MNRSALSALVLSLLLAFLFTGCGSSYHMVSKRYLKAVPHQTAPVYVTNPEMKREYEILRQSGIYEFTDNPQNNRTLTLHPIFHGGGCANPLMLTYLTLGVIPGALPGRVSFEFELETNGVVEKKSLSIPVDEYFSIWHHQSEAKKNKVLGEALAWSDGYGLLRSQAEQKPTTATP